MSLISLNIHIEKTQLKVLSFNEIFVFNNINDLLT